MKPERPSAAEAAFSLLRSSVLLDDGAKREAAAWAAGADEESLAGFSRFLSGEGALLADFARRQVLLGRADPAEVSAAVSKGWRRAALGREDAERRAEAHGIEDLFSAL